MSTRHLSTFPPLPFPYMLAWQIKKRIDKMTTAMAFVRRRRLVPHNYVADISRADQGFNLAEALMSPRTAKARIAFACMRRGEQKEIFLKRLKRSASKAQRTKQNNNALDGEIRRQRTEINPLCRCKRLSPTKRPKAPSAYTILLTPRLLLKPRKVCR